MDAATEQLSKIKILPVIKLEREMDAIPLAKALVNGGIPAAEVTFRSGCAAQSIQMITKNFPEMLTGAGTVLNVEQANAAVSAGAKFIVSPGFDTLVVRFCMNKNIPVYPGCATASEVQQAIFMGLNVLKFFPAEQSGGLDTIKALSGPFPQIRWIPTGGISLKNIEDYLAFPKIIACGGSFIAKSEYIAAQNWEMITEICRNTMRLIQGEKGCMAKDADRTAHKSK